MGGLLDGGLTPALEEFARRKPVPVTDLPGPFPPLPPDVELTVWFVCSEALANVTKHAQGVVSRDRAAMDGGVLRVRVTYYGSCRVDAAGAGIRGLADRARGHLGRS